MEPVDAVLVGAGMRGAQVYARYAEQHPERLRIVAVAEPDPARRLALARRHGLAPDHRRHPSATKIRTESFAGLGTLSPW